MTVTSPNNVPNHWAVLTSCSQAFQLFLSESPSRIGLNLSSGHLQFQNQGYCEIIKSGDFIYHIKAVEVNIELHGNLLANGEVAKLESGDKITFSVKNDTNQEIHNFIFSSIYTGVLEIQNEIRLRELLECSVCYGIIYDCVALDCMHNFCSDCIMDWLRKRQTCPLCKQKFLTLKKNPNMDDICQFYFQLYRPEELCQCTKEDRIISTELTFEGSDGTYTGQWKGIKKHGQGKMTWRSGEFFEGFAFSIFLLIFSKGHLLMIRW